MSRVERVANSDPCMDAGERKGAKALIPPAPVTAATAGDYRRLVGEAAGGVSRLGAELETLRTTKEDERRKSYG